MNGRARRLLALLLCFVLLGAAGCYYPGAEVPYVQTPAEVVTEMLRLAGVNGNDLVYDLGSGDGRLVIAAARDFGARGVGIEIDPHLVAQSAESARRAGVADRVKFRAADLFEADLSDATVVTLYLSPELNLRLRPKLLRELRPGSRIVSHDFPMGDWTPQHTISVPTRDRVSKVFLWVVPPSTAGAR
ncbi:MAG TPA: class I SAM-dependent methyltransferase [Methylomirabilota bacterium]|nr:class I SAM-dependent methyltransferase [Methylomirabilota bacterium]